MKIYLLENKTHSLPKELKDKFIPESYEIISLKLPSDHEEIHQLFEEQSRGAIFLPAIWEDLLSVKIVQEIKSLKEFFTIALVGKEGDLDSVICAFNNGLTGFLTAPVEETAFKQVFSRMKYLDEIHAQKLLKKASSNLTSTFTITEKENYLSKAFLDFLSEKGPFVSEQTSVLIVTSSPAQSNLLKELLQQLHITVHTVGSIDKAIETLKSNSVDLIISDATLKDGSAKDMGKAIHTEINQAIPPYLVWTSSYDTQAIPLEKDSHIDEVLPKPSSKSSLTSLLPSIVMWIYKVRCSS